MTNDELKRPRVLSFELPRVMFDHMRNELEEFMALLFVERLFIPYKLTCSFFFLNRQITT